MSKANLISVEKLRSHRMQAEISWESRNAKTPWHRTPMDTCRVWKMRRYFYVESSWTIPICSNSVLMCLVKVARSHGAYQIWVVVCYCHNQRLRNAALSATIFFNKLKFLKHGAMEPEIHFSSFLSMPNKFFPILTQNWSKRFQTHSPNISKHIQTHPCGPNWSKYPETKGSWSFTGFLRVLFEHTKNWRSKFHGNLWLPIESCCNPSQWN